MPDDFKQVCACGGKVSFPSELSGQVINCPHCKNPLRLESGKTKIKPHLIWGSVALILIGASIFVGTQILNSKSREVSSKPKIAEQIYSKETNGEPTTGLSAQEEPGDAESQYEMGKQCLDSKNYYEARKWFRLAADQNNAGGQNGLGVIYLDGLGVEADYDQAMKWLKKSADQGFSMGQFNLGRMYYRGFGIPADFTEAFKLFRESADSGHPTSQSMLGYMYLFGEGVPKNSQEAIKWFTKAASQGNPVAQGNMGTFYQKGDGVRKDSVEAYKWFSLAIAGGFLKPQEQLTLMSKSMTKDQIIEGKRRAGGFVKSVSHNEPPSESKEQIVFTDPSRGFKIFIDRILLAQRAVDEGLLWPHILENFKKQKKKLIYFHVSVSNMGAEQEVNLSYSGFTLEDTAGNSYSSEQTADYLHGSIHLGKTGRGGFAFAIYESSTPKKILFNTGLVRRTPGEYVGGGKFIYTVGDKIFAEADGLNELEIFGTPH